MKRERMTFSVCSAAVLLSSVIGFSCVMCLADTFGLLCRPEYLILACCITAGIAVAAMAVRCGWIVGMLAAICYVAALIWKAEAVADGFQTLLYQVTYAYSRCFEGVLPVGEPGADGGWLMMALAAPLTWLGVWIVCREGHAAIMVLACAPVLILCLIVVDLAPVFWLLLLSAALLLLMMSGYARSHSAHDGSRLIWWLVLPVATVFFVLLTLSPVESYVRSDWSANLQRVAEGNFDFSLWQKKVTSAVSAHWNGDLKQVNLELVGPKAKTGAYAMQYRSSAPIGYLRGSSLGHYEDNRWSGCALPWSLTVEQTQLIRPSAEYDTVLIETDIGEPLFYTAYAPCAAPENAMAADDSYFENPERVRGYAVRFAANAAAQILPEYEAFIYDAYLQLPAALQAPLEQYLQDNGLLGASAAAIADAVRAGGVYDLDTPAVPRGEDFALYFLTQSHRGYCVHFATSTVLLLRSAGIPARYVTGYAVDPVIDTWVEVTEDDAHAWVEYYVGGVGWLPLDPTPASGGEEPPDEITPPGEEPLPDRDPSVPDEAETDAISTAPALRREPNPASALLWWICLPAALLLIVLRRFVICYCRRVRAETGHPNRRALHLFRCLVRLYKARQEAVPEQWICLAEKAKFSQHKISREELESLSGEIGNQTAELKKASFFHRLWHRFGTVLY